MSIYPNTHPSVEPVSRAESGSAMWWTYTDAPLGEGHGIMWMEGEGWVLWRDQPSGTGDRFIEKLPETDVPNWARASVSERLRKENRA